MNTAVKGKLGLALLSVEVGDAHRALRGLRQLGLIPAGRMLAHVNTLLYQDDPGDEYDAEEEARAWLRQMSRQAP